VHLFFLQLLVDRTGNIVFCRTGNFAEKTMGFRTFLRRRCGCADIFIVLAILLMIPQTANPKLAKSCLKPQHHHPAIVPGIFQPFLASGEICCVTCKCSTQLNPLDTAHFYHQGIHKEGTAKKAATGLGRNN
jgi:hypothetical protein